MLTGPETGNRADLAETFSKSLVILGVLSLFKQKNTKKWIGSLAGCADGGFTLLDLHLGLTL